MTSLSSIFIPAVESQFKAYWPVLGGLLGLIIIGLVLKWRGRVKVLRYLANTFVYLGLVGGLIYLFRYEGVPYSSSPILIYAWALVIIGVILWIVMVHILQTPQRKKQQNMVQIKEKYLPKKKMRGK